MKNMNKPNSTNTFLILAPVKTGETLEIILNMGKQNLIIYIRK